MLTVLKVIEKFLKGCWETSTKLKRRVVLGLGGVGKHENSVKNDAR